MEKKKKKLDERSWKNNPDRRRLMIRLLLSATAILVMAFSLRAGIVEGISEETSTNTTLQNGKIAVFSGSTFKEPCPTELGKLLGREVEFVEQHATTTQGGLSQCKYFSTNKFGIIIVGFGGQDRMLGLPWEETETALREMFQRLKNTGAVVVYNQIVPDTSGFGYFPTSQVCTEEDVLLVPNLSENIMEYDPDRRALVFNPYFDLQGDTVHPNEEAYVVYAERTARALVDAGLGELAQSPEDILEDVKALLTNATDMIQDLGSRGMDTDTEKISKPRTRVDYLTEKGYHYTAKWELENKIIPPLETIIDRWDEIIQLFQEAQAHIDNVTLTGLDTQTIENMEQWYSTAENSWISKLDYGGTRWYLDKVLAVNEPTITITTCILSVIPAILNKLRKQVRNQRMIPVK